MKLDKKKAFAAKVLGVGRSRIVFNNTMLADIKESLTRQDIRDLVLSGAIFVRDIHGRRKVEKRKLRRRAGSIKKKLKRSKQTYMIKTRKLRAYLKELIRKNLITKERYLKLRREIRAHSFTDKAHLKERMEMLEK